MKRFAFVLSLLFALTSTAAQVYSVMPEFSRDPVGVKTYAAAPRLAERAAIAPASTLAAAAQTVPEELVALRDWNDSGKLPMKIGFTRIVGDPIAVHVDGAVAMKSGAASLARGLIAATDRGTLVWSGAVRVENADRIRLHLTNVKLPDGATLWVYGAGQAPVGFGKELLYEGSIYAPSVKGPVVYLELEIAAPKTEQDGASFEIHDLVELVEGAALRTFEPQPNDSPSCLVDATCVSTATFDAIGEVRSAVAYLEYVKGGSGFVCSGGLLNDRVPAPSFIPYLLTANHCFDTQSSASSLEAYFDYKTASCGGANPSPSSPAIGSTLLATGTASDFTFVRLNSVPGGRVFLGWTTLAINDGTKIHRVSHPFPSSFTFPAPQQYSNTNVNSIFGTCTNRPLSGYIYSTGGQGGTYGGSSGSPVVIAGGQVVGQLFGACGSDPSAGCDHVNNASVDGRFSATFPSIEQFINTTTATCTDSPTAMCLNNNRFKVEATYQAGSTSGQAQVVKLTSDTGYLWFFSSTNIEVVVKVLDACGINGYWVFAGGLTNVRVTLTVTDTKTGAVKTYVNPSDTAFQPIQDTSAFATCP
jgi:lysyl endopeptidase